MDVEVGVGVGGFSVHGGGFVGMDEDAKKIMVYTGHKSVASLMNYDTMDHKSAININF